MIHVTDSELKIILDILKAHAPEGEVWAFGSRQKGTHRKHSDLDLAVVGNDKQPLSVIGNLKEAFMDSTLPYRVDVLDYHAVLPSFREIIYLEHEAIFRNIDYSKEKSEWRQVRFGDIMINGPRNGIYKSKEYHGSGSKIVNMGELFANPRLWAVPMKRVELSEKERQNTALQSGDLLFARRSLVAEGAGRCSIVMAVDDDTTFESSIIRVRPNTEYADSLFLFYYFQSPVGKGAIRSIAREMAVSGVTGKDISNLEIVLPQKISNQQAIAATLSCLDDKIELNNKINANLEAQAQAIFKSWFVDFEPFRDGEFVDSELGPIPSGWRVGRFTEIANILGGGTPKTGVGSYWNGSIPFFTPKDAGGIYALTTEKYISSDGLTNCNSHLYPPNTVFITARGTVGKIALAGLDMAMNQSCYALTSKDKYSQYFVYGMAEIVVDSLKHKSSGAVFNAIVTRDFESEFVIIPDGHSIIKYHEIVEPLFASILNNTKQNLTLADIRDALLPKLMSGEIEAPIS